MTTLKPGQLAVVSTPIGNLGDLSPRAAELLKKADILACEDTRMTRKLLTLSGHQTAAKFFPYHDHNGHSMRPRLLKALSNGLTVALVSDAGTPVVSDPGFKLVAEAHECGFPVTAIPGPSAVLAGLACAGLASDRFLFAGFIPRNDTSARKSFVEFMNLPVTSIWFESPRRLTASLQIMAEVFGSRLGVVARELTKLHEELYRAPITELADKFAHEGPPRGEVVVLIEGASQTMPAFDDALLKTMLAEEMRNSSLRDAVITVAEISGQSRRKIYQLAIKPNS
ncbi:MAG: 16S rRNA (cytidine(1402)-2'-O)-methyltransferase [Candidatus Puniceispirillaceae bacterium]